MNLYSLNGKKYNKLSDIYIEQRDKIKTYNIIYKRYICKLIVIHDYSNIKITNRPEETKKLYYYSNNEKRYCKISCYDLETRFKQLQLFVVKNIENKLIDYNNFHQYSQIIENTEQIDILFYFKKKFDFYLWENVGGLRNITSNRELIKFHPILQIYTYYIYDINNERYRKLCKLNNIMHINKILKNCEKTEFKFINKHSDMYD